MFDTINGNWNIWYSLAVSLFVGMCILVCSFTGIFITECLSKRADRKLARKNAKRMQMPDFQDTVYDHRTHGF